MFRKALFVLITLQFLTAFFHALSLFSTPAGTNETEKQFVDLFVNYKQDLGLGFHRSTYQLFTGLSFCFTLLCVFSGWLNLYFLRNGLDQKWWKGFLFIQVIVFGALCVAMWLFTFLPPIVCTTLILITCIYSWKIASVYTLESK